MDSAPSVSYAVGRPLLAGLLAAALWLAGIAATLWWLHEADVPGWRHGAAAVALGVAGAWALTSWLRSPVGDVQWDGSAWNVPGQAHGDRVEVTMDLQHVLLVRWQGSPRAGWLWLERRRCPRRWLELRRAVYSRARPQALSAGRPPRATP